MSCLSLFLELFNSEVKYIGTLHTFDSEKDFLLKYLSNNHYYFVPDGNPNANSKIGIYNTKIKNKTFLLLIANTFLLIEYDDGDSKKE